VECFSTQEKKTLPQQLKLEIANGIEATGVMIQFNKSIKLLVLTLDNAENECNLQRNPSSRSLWHIRVMLAQKL
jgi:hypothetical protein